MRIISRNTSPLRSAVRESVRYMLRRNKGLSERVVGPGGMSSGTCTTRLRGSTTYKYWVFGGDFWDFRF